MMLILQVRPLHTVDLHHVYQGIATYNDGSRVRAYDCPLALVSINGGRRSASAERIINQDTPLRTLGVGEDQHHGPKPAAVIAAVNACGPLAESAKCFTPGDFAYRSSKRSHSPPTPKEEGLSRIALVTASISA